MIIANALILYFVAERLPAFLAKWREVLSARGAAALKKEALDSGIALVVVGIAAALFHG